MMAVLEYVMLLQIMGSKHAPYHRLYVAYLEGVGLLVFLLILCNCQCFFFNSLTNTLGSFRFF
jgi:hypothetical protein